MVHITLLQFNIRPQLVDISKMNYCVLLAIVSTIFAYGECLKCYQCTLGEDSTMTLRFGMLPECFFDNHDDVCEAMYHCSTIIFDSNPESLTIMYDCDLDVIDIPHYVATKHCLSDLCNREIATSTDGTTFPSTITILENVTVTTESDIEHKSGASSVIFSATLSFFVLITIFFV